MKTPPTATTTPAQGKDTAIGLNDKQRAHSAKILSSLLADGVLIYQKTRNYHWNVTGPQFRSLHLLFEEQYTAIAESVDEIAERIRSVGHFAPGTLEEFKKLSQIQETPGELPPALEMVRNLAADHEAIIRTMRDAIDELDEHVEDQGTADFVTALMEAHEKFAWMLRAHLE